MMKYFQTYAMLAVFSVLLLVTGCKQKDPIAPSDLQNETNANSGTIGNEVFTATETTSFENSQGEISFSLKSNNRAIQFTTSDKIAGTYSIQASNFRISASNIANASLVVDSKIYLASTGTVTIIEDEDGNLSGTFEFTAKNSEGQTLEVKNGVFSGVEITQPGFQQLLTSKSWRITKYEFEDLLNNLPKRDFYNQAIWTRNSESTDDPCNWTGTTTSPEGTWGNYIVGFTSGLTIGAFSYDFKKPDWNKSSSHPDTCRLIFATESKKDNIVNAWTYNESQQTLKTSFGELYQILDDQPEYMEMEYKVVSFSPDKIELEGKQYLDANDNPATSGTLFLISNITLE